MFHDLWLASGSQHDVRQVNWLRQNFRIAEADMTMESCFDECWLAIKTNTVLEYQRRSFRDRTPSSDVRVLECRTRCLSIAVNPTNISLSHFLLPRTQLYSAITEKDFDYRRNRKNFSDIINLRGNSQAQVFARLLTWRWDSHAFLLRRWALCRVTSHSILTFEPIPTVVTRPNSYARCKALVSVSFKGSTTPAELVQSRL